MKFISNFFLGSITGVGTQIILGSILMHYFDVWEPGGAHSLNLGPPIKYHLTGILISGILAGYFNLTRYKLLGTIIFSIFVTILYFYFFWF